MLKELKIGDIYLHRLDDREVIVNYISDKGDQISIRYADFKGQYHVMMVNRSELKEVK